MSNPTPIPPDELARPVDGGSGALSYSVRTALGYAADVVAKEHPLGNGRTALYWHLVGVVATHVAQGEAKRAAEGTVAP